MLFNYNFNAKKNKDYIIPCYYTTSRKTSLIDRIMSETYQMLVYSPVGIKVTEPYSDLKRVSGPVYLRYFG